MDGEAFADHGCRVDFNFANRWRRLVSMMHRGLEGFRGDLRAKISNLPVRPKPYNRFEINSGFGAVTTISAAPPIF